MIPHRAGIKILLAERTQTLLLGIIPFSTLQNILFSYIAKVQSGEISKSNLFVSMDYIGRAHKLLTLFHHNFTGAFVSNVYTIWLFTYSDLKTIIMPSAAFGLMNGIALSLDSNTDIDLSPQQVLKKAPTVIYWVWINLLPFAIDNQRQHEAVQEDLLNKPWRPLPSRRISAGSAKSLMTILYLVAVATSFFLGNMTQCLTLIVLGFCYNDLGGSDSGIIVRNFINASGFICFSSGALQVVVGLEESALDRLSWWLIVIAAIVFSTVQTQDMYDQRGDAIRRRRTLPLVIGDGPARWTIAGPMVLWCWLTPWFWGSSIIGYLAPVTLGMTVATRTLRVRNEKGDLVIFRLWNLWLVSVYLLPLIKGVEAQLSRQNGLR
jgi:4-hydroxybenzoate polyprenyltransferase